MGAHLPATYVQPGDYIVEIVNAVDRISFPAQWDPKLGIHVT